MTSQEFREFLLQNWINPENPEHIDAMCEYTGLQDSSYAQNLKPSIKEVGVRLLNLTQAYVNARITAARSQLRLIHQAKLREVSLQPLVRSARRLRVEELRDSPRVFQNPSDYAHALDDPFCPAPSEFDEVMTKSWLDRFVRDQEEHRERAKPGTDLARQHLTISLMGSPGTGKTTVLKRLMYKVDQAYADKLTAVFLPLTIYNGQGFSGIREAVASFYREKWSWSDVTEVGPKTLHCPIELLLEHEARNHRLLAVLDSLDEAEPIRRADVINHLQKFAAQSGPVFLTSRFVPPRIDLVRETDEVHFLGGLEAKRLPEYIDQLATIIVPRPVDGGDAREQDEAMSRRDTLRKVAAGIETMTVDAMNEDVESEGGLSRAQEAMQALSMIVNPVFLNLYISACLDRGWHRYTTTGVVRRYIEFLFNEWSRSRSVDPTSDTADTELPEIEHDLGFAAYLSALMEYADSHFLTLDELSSASVKFQLSCLPDQPESEQRRIAEQTRRIWDAAKTAELVTEIPSGPTAPKLLAMPAKARAFCKPPRLAAEYPRRPEIPNASSILREHVSRTGGTHDETEVVEAEEAAWSPPSFSFSHPHSVFRDYFASLFIRRAEEDSRAIKVSEDISRKSHFLEGPPTSSHWYTYASYAEFLRNPNLRFYENAMQNYVLRFQETRSELAFHDLAKMALDRPTVRSGDLELGHLPDGIDADAVLDEAVPSNLIFIGNVFANARRSTLTHVMVRRLRDQLAVAVSQRYLTTNFEKVFKSLSSIYRKFRDPAKPTDDAEVLTFIDGYWPDHGSEDRKLFQKVDEAWRRVGAADEKGGRGDACQRLTAFGKLLLEKLRKVTTRDQIDGAGHVLDVLLRRIAYKTRYHGDSFDEATFDWLREVHEFYGKHGKKSRQLMIYDSLAQLYRDRPSAETAGWQRALHDWKLALDRALMEDLGNLQERFAIRHEHNSGEDWLHGIVDDNFVSLEHLHFWRFRPVFTKLLANDLRTRRYLTERYITVMSDVIEREQKRRGARKLPSAVEGKAVYVLTEIARSSFRARQYFLPATYSLAAIGAPFPKRSKGYEAGRILRMLIVGAARGVGHDRVGTAGMENLSSYHQLYDLYQEALWEILHGAEIAPGVDPG